MDVVRPRRVGVIWWTWASLLCGVAVGQKESAPHFALTRIDDAATHVATFQSHNQKVIENAHGVFMTHVRRRNPAYTAQTWRLSRSTDGGRTFATVFEDTHATNPPVLESDSDGHVYLVRTDFESGDAFLYRFDAATGFSRPRITKIPGGAAGKYALALDARTKRLFYLAHNGIFHELDLSGKVLSRQRLIRRGPQAGLQYPHLAVDASGRVHAAWTTTRHGSSLYWSIHYMVRARGSGTWWARGKEVDVPVPADGAGASQQINGADELPHATWLSSLGVQESCAHFMYLCQAKPVRQRYVRIEVRSGERQIDRGPRIGGERFEVRGLDGFFATSEPSSGSLYYVGADPAGHLVCLRSDDRGGTWRDHARTRRAYRPYAIGGCRRLANGDVIGSFTDVRGTSLETEHASHVHFFRIPGRRARRSPR